MTMKHSFQIEYLDPTGSISDAKLTVRTIRDLRDRNLAFVNNGWRSFTRIGERMEAALKDQFGLKSMQTYAVPTAGPPESALFDRIISECDAAVVGLAN